MKKYLSVLSFIIVISLILISCGPSAVTVSTRPERPVYSRPISPGPSYVWVEGDWMRRDGRYVYKPGYWAAPRPRHSYWVEGHWQARRGGWYWVPGHWR